MAKELTLEQATEKIAALEAENLDLKKQVKAKSVKVAELSNEVFGTYKNKDVEVKFKPGCHQFKMGGVVYKSAEAIENPEIMETLIAEKCGIIEIVQPSK